MTEAEKRMQDVRLGNLKDTPELNASQKLGEAKAGLVSFKKKIDNAESDIRNVHNKERDEDTRAMGDKAQVDKYMQEEDKKLTDKAKSILEGQTRELPNTSPDQYKAEGDVLPRKRNFKGIIRHRTPDTTEVKLEQKPKMEGWSSENAEDVDLPVMEARIVMDPYQDWERNRFSKKVIDKATGKPKQLKDKAKYSRPKFTKPGDAFDMSNAKFYVSLIDPKTQMPVFDTRDYTWSPELLSMLFKELPDMAKNRKDENGLPYRLQYNGIVLNKPGKFNNDDEVWEYWGKLPGESKPRILAMGPVEDPQHDEVWVEKQVPELDEAGNHVQLTRKERTPYFDKEGNPVFNEVPVFDKEGNPVYKYNTVKEKEVVDHRPEGYYFSRKHYEDVNDDDFDDDLDIDPRLAALYERTPRDFVNPSERRMDKKKSTMLTASLNSKEGTKPIGDFTALIGPEAPYRDPNYDWEADPTGEKQLREESYIDKKTGKKVTKKYGPRKSAKKWFIRGDDIMDSTDSMVLKEGTDRSIYLPEYVESPLYNLSSSMWPSTDDSDFEKKVKAVFDFFSNPDNQYTFERWGKGSNRQDFSKKGIPGIKGDFDFGELNYRLMDKKKNEGYFPELTDYLESKMAPKEKSTGTEVSDLGTATMNMKDDPKHPENVAAAKKRAKVKVIAHKPSVNVDGKNYELDGMNVDSQGNITDTGTSETPETKEHKVYRINGGYHLGRPEFEVARDDDGNVLYKDNGEKKEKFKSIPLVKDPETVRADKEMSSSTVTGSDYPEYKKAVADAKAKHDKAISDLIEEFAHTSGENINTYKKALDIYSSSPDIKLEDKFKAKDRLLDFSKKFTAKQRERLQEIDDEYEKDIAAAEKLIPSNTGAPVKVIKHRTLDKDPNNLDKGTRTAKDYAREKLNEIKGRKNKAKIDEAIWQQIQDYNDDMSIEDTKHAIATQRAAGLLNGLNADERYRIKLSHNIYGNNKIGNLLSNILKRAARVTEEDIDISKNGAVPIVSSLLKDAGIDISDNSEEINRLSRLARDFGKRAEAFDALDPDLAFRTVINAFKTGLDVRALEANEEMPEEERNEYDAIYNYSLGEALKQIIAEQNKDKSWEDTLVKRDDRKQSQDDYINEMLARNKNILDAIAEKGQLEEED